MNIRVCIVLILSLTSNILGTSAIEIGLKQECGGSTSSYIYNPMVLCQPKDCTCYGGECGYWCDAIGYRAYSGASCDRIMVPPGTTPGTVLCDPAIDAPPGECSSPNGIYFCGNIMQYVTCSKQVVAPPTLEGEINVETYSSTEYPSKNVPPNFTECPDLPAPTIIIPKLGNGTFKPPEPSSLITTSEWGEVPANQILVIMKKGCHHCIAMELANKLNGSVVGYIDFINLYQIEIPGKNEMDLRAAISQAKLTPYIESAFPHQKVFPEKSPLDDPVYSKGGDKSYRIVGVLQSWDAIKSSGIALTPVKIGVVDDGLYKGYREFDGIVHINTKSSGSLLEKPSSDYPIAGSHGTGIMNLIAADPDNGGLVGIASGPLRDNLTVTMTNMLSPIYSKSGDAWYMGYMLALSNAAIGSDLLSFSWGNSEADPGAVTASEEFFKEWATTYPDHLFICSAGNDGNAMDGSRRFPYTHHMPNVITVGCINNDGTLNRNSNRVSGNFEVTLAVPGDQAVWGRDDKGRIEDSGGETSMSVPFVTATAALIRSLDPSLNASSIKSLLVETARTSIDVGNGQVPAPKEVGGGILAIDLAVQKAIANLRNSTGVVA